MDADLEDSRVWRLFCDDTFKQCKKSGKYIKGGVGLGGLG